MPAPHCDPRYLIAISGTHWQLTSICLSGSLVRPGPVSGQPRPVVWKAHHTNTVLQNLLIFFPLTSEESEESSLISPPRLGVPFRLVHSNYS